jgi:hypothetical protein
MIVIPLVTIQNPIPWFDGYKVCHEYGKYFEPS